MKKIYFVLTLLFTISLPIFAEGGLDSSIRQATGYLKNNIPQDNTRLAILSLNSSRLENYFVDELTDGVRNATKLSIVDRTQLAAIAAEQGFQMSGEVSDDDQVALGRKAGARRIVSVSIVHIGNEQYRFRVRVVDVETAELHAAQSYTVKDNMIAALLDQPVTATVSTATGESSNPISLQTNGSWVNQTMNHSEMWYTVRPSANGYLLVETAGNLDTLMGFYEGNSLLSEDDDSGSSLNARTEYQVRAGRTYHIKVNEYSYETGGNFRIRAALSQTSIFTTNESNPITLQASGSWVNQTMSFYETWFAVRPSSNGTLTIETDGNLDTMIELYDESTMLDSDDDSGNNMNAKLECQVNGGKTYQVKVWQYNHETGGSFRIRASIR